MNSTQKKALVTILVVILGVALLYGLRWFVEKFPPVQRAEQEQTQTTDQVASEIVTPPEEPVVTPPKGKTAYEKALETYKYRIQFVECRGIIGTPSLGGTMSIKKGTKIMLDNRDKVAHTIAFKGVSTRVGAQNFAIVTASVLGAYNVTCDGGGSAALNVQQ